MSERLVLEQKWQTRCSSASNKLLHYTPEAVGVNLYSFSNVKFVLLLVTFYQLFIPLITVCNFIKLQLIFFSLFNRGITIHLFADDTDTNLENIHNFTRIILVYTKKKSHKTWTALHHIAVSDKIWEALVLHIPSLSSLYCKWNKWLHLWHITWHRLDT